MEKLFSTMQNKCLVLVSSLQNKRATAALEMFARRLNNCWEKESSERRGRWRVLPWHESQKIKYNAEQKYLGKLISVFIPCWSFCLHIFNSTLPDVFSGTFQMEIGLLRKLQKHSSKGFYHTDVCLNQTQSLSVSTHFSPPTLIVRVPRVAVAINTTCKYEVTHIRSLWLSHWEITNWQRDESKPPLFIVGLISSCPYRSRLRLKFRVELKVR